MIKIEYSHIPDEIAKATLAFFMNRPFLNMLFLFMKLSCLLLCVGFALTAYAGSTRAQDYVAVLCAILWLRFYKKINKAIISRSLKLYKLPHNAQSFNVDKQRIFYK